jgi:hypothetical protein
LLAGSNGQDERFPSLIDGYVREANLAEFGKVHLSKKNQSLEVDLLPLLYSLIRICMKDKFGQFPSGLAKL